MGCWNKTCGLSGLHIWSGTEVIVFALEQHTDYHDRCYTTAFWKPVWVPFYSKYNDYGGGEGSYGIGFDLLMKGLKEQLIEKDVGENECHDIAVRAADMNEELFFNAVHEGRLEVTGWRNKTSLVDFVMFRKDVVDDILANFKCEDYVGDGKGTHGWNDNYITYGFSDVLASVPEFMTKLKAKLESVTDPAMRKYAGSRELFDFRDPNLAAKYLRDSDNYRYSKLIRPFTELDSLVMDGRLEQAEELLKDWLTMSYLDSFMHSTRKVWVPGSHEGSQASSHHGYRVLSAAVNSALDREKAEFLEENDIEEWSDM
jgi:hypothetical protein